MQKAIKITKDVLGVGIFLGMSYLLIVNLFGYWNYYYYPYHDALKALYQQLSIAVTGLSMLYVLKRLL